MSSTAAVTTASSPKPSCIEGDAAAAAIAKCKGFMYGENVVLISIWQDHEVQVRCRICSILHVFQVKRGKDCKRLVDVGD